MALKRLPNNVQSLLCASAQVNSYKRAIEELIYNSLDAKSTSIAIRIHIQESTIQVIDNGNGITKHDFNAIGQRHMTSKVTDLATLKAAPKNYGYRGEFIANIITVSQMVKITSRHESVEETWAKTFVDGREKKFAQMTTRPTKGTTVDIKGFLYNLNIQKRSIDSMNELQNIKSFLEQLSLMHNHISLSLRDDAQNEIIFKIHKKRDIYQTLSSLFNIDKDDLVELQVEKQEYKVKGFIAKTDKELDLYWIFLNGKFIHSCSKLHKILNDSLKKYLHIKDYSAFKSKKIYDKNQLFNQNIPFYFIFVSCPYIDYDLSDTPKQSVIEFKNWEQINKLLQKLVKFYAGDNNLQEIKKVEDKLINKQPINTKVNQDTRDQVKKIMDKILGSNSKKLGVSQLQNGIKGKMVKRKVKKKTNRCTNIPKLCLQNLNQNNNTHASLKSKAEAKIPENDIVQTNVVPTVNNSDKKKKESKMLANPKTLKRKNEIKVARKKYKNKEMPTRNNHKNLKANIVSQANKKYKTTMKQKHTQEATKVINNKLRYFVDSDSVCKRSKIVAQKVEHFLQNTKKRNNINHASRQGKDNNHDMVLRKDYCAINDRNIHAPSKINKYMIEKYIMGKLRAKSYKTTYDLVETVLKSQQELINDAENNMSEETNRAFYKRNDTLRCVSMVPKRFALTNKHMCHEYSTNDTTQNRVSQYKNNNFTQLKKYTEYENNFSEYASLCGQKEDSDVTTNVLERLECIDKDNDTYNQNYNMNIYCTRTETSYRSVTGPLKILTYDSHQYHNRNDVNTRDNTKSIYTTNKKQNLRFITKESRDNFTTANDFGHRFKKPFTLASNKQTKNFDIRMKQTIDESYTIEYSDSYENNFNKSHITELNSCSKNFIKDNDCQKHGTVNYEPLSPTNYVNPASENTYTIYSSFDKNDATEKNINKRKSPTLGLFDTYSLHESNIEINKVEKGSKSNKDDFTENNKNFNIVFVSKSQQHTETVFSNDMIIEPLNICETILDEIGSGEKEFAISFNENNHKLNDSLYGFINDALDEHIVKERGEVKLDIVDTTENVSHHFSCAVKTNQPNVTDNNINDNFQLMERQQNEIANICPRDLLGLGLTTEHITNTEHKDCNFEVNFNFKNRPRFVPKGMSQIFENCRTKTICDYDMDIDYYEDSIYNKFANNVQLNSEIYEPIIQNVDDLTTKNIHKFQNKVKKDTASLVFDEISLKDAKVLGQADCKFIVATMKKRCDQTKEGPEYLILFDQHAVHERIRLEKHLADYFKQEKWTSVAVDNIILKISKDELLYLHNYKDKFIQLGLQWTILNDNEVTVNSIPAAILGKIPREVEKVIKAVRNLIVEEINIIKLQKGCVSLYPKSIMDLVFSESCRYAIKFGDSLSKSDCIELIDDLSNCKTPFQCAHGRPVMAVIMDIIPGKREYKIKIGELRRFRQRNKGKR